ncbi:UV-endonuclease UvdE-domain-containing protein [Ephemerocybe angulata]|uniref:UV-endonuclease UvdE-domain-containing protein n=1 Tax=Ephemerocybe angulata TaxID=980116 RepID=A0A8H6I9X5_9AGAR|nr:UV-endonuclease UvdE-domain-containing protein [Tulosesus angulatus]
MSPMRAHALRSITTTKAALDQEAEGSVEPLASTVTQVHIHRDAAEVKSRRKSKGSATAARKVKVEEQTVVHSEATVKTKGRQKSKKTLAPDSKVLPAEADGASRPLGQKRKRKDAASDTEFAPSSASAEAGGTNDGETVKEKKKRKVKVREEPVYIIPDVEKKQTTFKGRLGYACLNTVLRNKKPATDSIFCSRTCRIDSIKKNGMDWVKTLGRRNVEDLLHMIQWNEDNNIKFMRLSSEMFPFASHSKYGYSLEYCSEILAKAGALANKYGHRLTVHPGQYTQLGSNKPAVIDSAIRELDYHCQMLDLMGIGPDGVMVVHGGGVYEDKSAALARIKHTVSQRLAPNVRARLVLENDEMCYNAEDLLPLCEELEIPLVFDYHHDQIYPSSIPPSEIIARANAIFAKRGIKPKQHLSEPRPGAVTVMERRAHADRCENLPPDLPDDMGGLFTETRLAVI